MADRILLRPPTPHPPAFISDTWNHHCQKCLRKCFHSPWRCGRVLLFPHIQARLFAETVCRLDAFFQGARKTLLRCRSILRNCFHHSSTSSALQRSKHRRGERNSCRRNLNQEQSRRCKMLLRLWLQVIIVKKTKNIQMVINYASGSVNVTRPAVHSSSGLKTCASAEHFPESIVSTSGPSIAKWGCHFPATQGRKNLKWHAISSDIFMVWGQWCWRSHLYISLDYFLI